MEESYVRKRNRSPSARNPDTGLKFSHLEVSQVEPIAAKSDVGKEETKGESGNTPKDNANSSLLNAGGGGFEYLHSNLIGIEEEDPQDEDDEEDDDCCDEEGEGIEGLQEDMDLDIEGDMNEGDLASDSDGGDQDGVGSNEKKKKQKMMNK